MEFIIQKDVFSNYLKIADHVSSVKGIQVILSNIYLEASEDGELILKSSDLDLSVFLKVKAVINKPGKITLPSKKLNEIISKLQNDEVLIETDEKTNRATIKSGRAKFELMGIDAVGYPVIITDEEIKEFKNNIKIDTKPFIKAIKQTSYAASVTDNNSIYNGVFMKIEGKNLEMAATDGARLSMIEETIENKDEKTFEAIIPSRTLNEFLKFITVSDEGKVEILKKDGQIIFKTGDCLLISRSIEGQFPKYKQIIPNDNNKTVLVNREEFLSALDRMSSMVDEKKNAVKLLFEENKLTLVVENAELGESRDFIDTVYKDEDVIKTAFNYKYLMDILRNYETENVKIELKTTLSTTLIKPDSDDKYTALISPMQIRE